MGECGGGSICEHGRHCSQCKECGGRRSRCKECGGGRMCECHVCCDPLGEREAVPPCVSLRLPSAAAAVRVPAVPHEMPRPAPWPNQSLRPGCHPSQRHGAL